MAIAETSSNPEVRKHLAAQSFQRAKELINQKDFHPAVEMLREAIRFVPDNAEYRLCLGNVELKNSMWISKGLENLKEAARLEPRRVHYILAAARALHQHGRNDEAEPFARRAVDLDPSPENQELLDRILLRAAPKKEPEPPEPEGPLDFGELVPESGRPGLADEAVAPDAAAAPPPPPRSSARPSLFSRIFRHRN